MFIGKVSIRDGRAIFSTIDGEEYNLAHKGKLLIEGEETTNVLLRCKDNIRLVGFRIGNILNTIRRDGPLVVFEEIGISIINLLGMTLKW